MADEMKAGQSIGKVKDRTDDALVLANMCPVKRTST